MLRGMVRWHKKHRVLRCYLCIVGWLALLLIFLSYWHADTPPLSSGAAGNGGSVIDYNGGASQDKPRLKKLRQLCNTPDRIHAITEGRVPQSKYELIGVIITVRHGDRGPIVPVRNLSSINCGHRSLYASAYKNYVSSILNISKTMEYSNFASAFLTFPVLPTMNRCNVAQLTPQGIMQHLKLGKVLKDVYIKQWDLLSHPWEADDVLVYSTKFKRTFQSALAFLYGFLPKFDLTMLKLQEGQGLSFCNSNCRCDLVALLDDKYDHERNAYRKSHPGVMELLEKLSAIIKDGPGAPDITNPVVMRDALMAYTCHNHKLPCLEGVCIQPEDVSSIISYEEWETKQKKSFAKQRSSKLKVYGFLRDVVKSIDTMMRDGQPKFVLYSAHDKTLSFILMSLGVSVYQLPNYASRLILEVYRNTSIKIPISDHQYRLHYFFRVVYNGKDITKMLSFCEAKSVSSYTSNNGLKTTINLCPVTKLDNFIRADNYFKDFNASSFRQACAIKSEGVAAITEKLPHSRVPAAAAVA